MHEGWTGKSRFDAYEPTGRGNMNTKLSGASSGPSSHRCRTMTRLQGRSLAHAICRAIALPTVLFLAHPSPALAAQSAETVCLATKQQDGDSKGGSLVIAVPADKADKYKKRGLTVSDCAAATVQSSAQRTALCAAASISNRTVRLQMWKRFSLTPLELCQDTALSATQ